MQKKVLGLVAVLVIAIAIGGYNYPRVQPQAPQLGAVPTLDGVDVPYVRINGNGYYNYRQSMTATSSVLCSVKNPFGSATSTLVDYSAQVTGGTLVASQTLDVATSSTALGTSSPAFVKEFALAAGGQASLYWSQTAATSTRLIGGTDTVTGQSYAIVGPNEFVNLKIASATPGTFATYLTGSCRGTFRSLSN